MRPPIREISNCQFMATDRPGWRAYSGTPLPDRASLNGAIDAEKSDPQNLYGFLKCDTKK